ncbi:HIRAN domain-containing protein [Lachnospiraceae bacterium C1.1]|nr:HIRAN domain-containing protein [Lachnospiraceae bacterium C1.1]
MDNELTIGKKSVVAIMQNRELGEIIKPLSREIFLFDTFIAGTTHLEDISVLDDIKIGDRLILQREDNRFDSNAILTLDEKKRKLGYVPEKDNIVFARLMDAGKLLFAKIKSMEMKGSFRRIRIGIYLVDF